MSIRHVMLLLALIPAHLACAAFSPPQPVMAGDMPVLEEDEGLLLLHVESDVPIESIVLHGPIASYMVSMSGPYGLFVFKEGEYRIGGHRNTRDARWMKYRYPDGKEPGHIRVLRGCINYAGTLKIWHWWLWASFRTLNASSLALAAVEKSHRELLDRYPLRYTGFIRDDFLAEYQKAAAKLTPPDDSIAAEPDSLDGTPPHADEGAGE